MQAMAYTYSPNGESMSAMNVYLILTYFKCFVLCYYLYLYSYIFDIINYT